MKKPIGLITLIATAAAACGVAYLKLNKNRIKGSFVADAALWNLSLVFKGKSVTLTLVGKLSGKVTEAVGTYLIEDDTISLFFDEDDVQMIFGTDPIVFRKKGKKLIFDGGAEFVKQKKKA